MNLEEIVHQLADTVARIESKLDEFEPKFDGLRTDINRVEQQIEPKIDGLQADINRIEPKFDSLQSHINRVELKVEQRDIALRKEMREQRSQDRDRMEMLKNQVEGATTLALGGGRGPEPPRYVSTGTGLIDPEWRWDREHPFRR